MVIENGNRVLFVLKVEKGGDGEVILHYGEETESAKRVSE